VKYRYLARSTQRYGRIVERGDVKRKNPIKIADPDALVLVLSILGCYTRIRERRWEREGQGTITDIRGRFIKMLSLLDGRPICKSSCVPFIVTVMEMSWNGKTHSRLTFVRICSYENAPCANPVSQKERSRDGEN
jgi:hypothetical protein